MERNRAAGEIPAHQRGDMEGAAVLLRGRRDFRRGLRLRRRPVNPRGDFSAVVIVRLIVDVGRVGEEREEAGKLACVRRVEKGRDRGGKGGDHEKREGSGVDEDGFVCRSCEPQPGSRERWLHARSGTCQVPS